MELKEIMNYKNFVIIGDTLNPDKYACKIKNKLIENNYNVECVGKELKSINDCKNEIDIIDLCINPIKGLELLKENKKDFKCVLIQPGAESDDIKNYLNNINKPYLEGCALVGISLYRRKK